MLPGRSAHDEPVRPGPIGVLIELFLSPASLFERLGPRPPFALGLAVGWGGILLTSLAETLRSGHRLVAASPLAPAGWFFGLAFVALVLAGTAGWFLGAAILHLTAELVGGRGSVLALFATLGLVSLPHTLATLLPPFRESLPSPLPFLLDAAGTLASFSLLFLALRPLYRVGTAQALLILLLPPAFAFSFLLLILFPLFPVLVTFTIF